jgi:hypothetical protein
MNMEILKGYCVKVRGQQEWRDTGLQDELFALFKLAWLENARLLARRKGQNYYFLASFLGEEETARFTENFACRRPTVPRLRPFEAEDERGFVPWGQVVPKDVVDHLTARLAADEDLEDASIASMIERDSQDSDGDYLFTVPEETKERWLKRKQQQEKKKV